MKKALMLASVASMIDQFNMENIRLLQDKGYQVDVVTNFENGSTTSQQRVNEVRARLEVDGVHTIHMPIPRTISDIKGIVDSYKAVKKLCDENKYELLHCHSPIGSVVARIGAKHARKKYGTRVIYTAHGFHFFKGAPIVNWLTFFPVEWACSFFTDTLITINKEDYARAKKLLHAKETEYVPGVGIDTQTIKNVVPDKNAKFSEFEITNEIVFLSVGELNRNKNQEVIIKALSRIDRPFKYILCGKGDKKEYLERLSEELGIKDRVIFAGYRTDVRELLNCADVFCFPSYREGLSVALMEAMAAGLPCVVSKIRGNVDLIQDGVNGYLCNPASVDEFETALKKLCDNKQLLYEMRKSNYRIIQDFDRNVVEKDMEKIY
ncbi:MAG: glycosyltransferase family 4 protein [bacterium]|nr:glycosyltransferase family 4 protein [bacterium]